MCVCACVCVCVRACVCVDRLMMSSTPQIKKYQPFLAQKNSVISGSGLTSTFIFLWMTCLEWVLYLFLTASPQSRWDESKATLALDGED